MIYTSERDFKSDYVNPEFNSDHAQDFYTADVVDTTRSFARNYGGYPRSDIAIINEQNNQEVALTMIDRLQTLAQDGHTDMTVEQLRQARRSKYCQTPSEQCLWIENQLEIAENYARSLQDQANIEEENKQKAARRKAFEESLTPEEREVIRKLRRDKEIKDYVEG